MGLFQVAWIVDDYDAGAAFLRDALGFAVVEDVPARMSSGAPKRWLVMRHPDGGASVLVARADGAQQEAAIGHQFAGRVGFFVDVDDVRATLERVAAHGGSVESAPRAEAYGTVAVVLDPWGNRWDVIER